jgi:hypothetical protein
MSTLMPEFVKFGHRMAQDVTIMSGPPSEYNFSPPQVIFLTSMADDEWRETYLKELIGAVKRYNFDGVYLDGNPIPRGSTNPQGGLGYRASDGSLRPTFAIFAYRDFFRRLYETLHPMGKRIDAHQSSCVATADLAFVDSYWDGEAIGAAANEEDMAKDPLRLFSPAAFRAEFMGRNFGIPPELIRYSPSEAKTWMGISMLHDVLVRPTNPPELAYISPIWKALGEFGVSQADWHPYWDNGNLVKADTGDVKISFYRRVADNSARLLLVVTNFSREQIETSVTLSEQAIGSIHDTTDALTRKELEHSPHMVRIPLAGSEWRLVRVD